MWPLTALIGWTYHFKDANLLRSSRLWWLLKHGIRLGSQIWELPTLSHQISATSPYIQNIWVIITLFAMVMVFPSQTLAPLSIFPLVTCSLYIIFLMCLVFHKIYCMSLNLSKTTIVICVSNNHDNKIYCLSLNLPKNYHGHS